MTNRQQLIKQFLEAKDNLQKAKEELIMLNKQKISNHEVFSVSNWKDWGVDFDLLSGRAILMKSFFWLEDFSDVIVTFLDSTESCGDIEFTLHFQDIDRWSWTIDLTAIQYYEVINHIVNGDEEFILFLDDDFEKIIFRIKNEDVTISIVQRSDEDDEDDELGRTADFTLTKKELINIAEVLKIEMKKEIKETRTEEEPHWIRTGDFYSGEYDSMDYYACSVCNEVVLDGDDFSYCPHCGSKMTGQNKY